MNTTLTPTDLHYVCSRMPKDVRTMLQENSALFVAGGFIRAVIAGEHINDIDVFGPDKATLQAAANALAVKRGGRVHTTDNAITVLAMGKTPIQFITRWVFSDGKACVDSFDFTICQAAIYASAGLFQSICSASFYPDLAARRLTYTAPVRNEDAGGSLLRVIKYVKRGYTVQTGSLGAVVARLVSGVRERQDGQPMDEKWRAQVITGLLREVDPLSVIDGIEVADEDAQ